MMIKFPSNRPYSEIEALVDYFCNIKRGRDEVKTSYTGLAEKWMWSKSSVHRFITMINLEQFWNENETLLRLKNSELSIPAGKKVRRKRDAPKPNSTELNIDYPAELFREGLIYPFDTILFRGAWKQWIMYKFRDWKFRYKSIESEQAAINLVAKQSNYNEQMAADMIESSIAHNWQGIYVDKNVREKYGTLKRREREIMEEKNKDPKDTWSETKDTPEPKDTWSNEKPAENNTDLSGKF